MISKQSLKLSLYRRLAACYPPESNSRIVGGIVKIAARLGPTLCPYGSTNLWVQPYDSVDRHVLLGRHLNPFFTSACRQYLREEGIVVDIGANSGALSMIAATKAATVYAFEPSPRELNRLRDNIALNPLGERVKVLPFALGAVDGTVDLHVSPAINMGRNATVPLPDAIEVLRIKTARFDSVMEPDELARICVVKIDVEGAEASVLDGMSASMDSLRGAAFVIEMSPELLKRSGSSVEYVRTYFLSRGFRSTLQSEAGEQWEEVFIDDTRLPQLQFHADLSVV
jgi:FkbM family methyltransferase